jgi:hypothetical protein
MLKKSQNYVLQHCELFRARFLTRWSSLKHFVACGNKMGVGMDSEEAF